jgi:endoglucanase
MRMLGVRRRTGLIAIGAVAALAVGGTAVAVRGGPDEPAPPPFALTAQDAAAASAQAEAQAEVEDQAGARAAEPTPAVKPSRKQRAATRKAPVRQVRAAATGTPVGINGRLQVCGVHLCNQDDNPVQLRGMSTHGIQWFDKCYTKPSLDALAEDWNADFLRIAMYVQEEGYETAPATFTARVNDLVDEAEARGLYSIIDFHTLTPGDPNANLSNAKTFFASVAARNAAKKNVIYEIANEPNGVSWTKIKSYAEQVIPVIRNADPDAVILVGTRGWSSLGVSDGASESEVVNDPVDARNIMYSFHFYAASHKDNYRDTLTRAAAKLPVFVSEFGTVEATGGGAVDVASTTRWLDLLDSLKIGYANWTFSDADEGSAAFKPGTCSGGTYAGTGVLTESGKLIRARIRTADSFSSD